MQFNKLIFFVFFFFCSQQFVKRESKARKSFPNSNSLQVIPPLRKNSLTLLDSPTGQKHVKSTSGVLPPAEAGPVTASIYRNSQELVAKMAQLIAETIKDAAESGDSNSMQQSEATIHDLKLQIERLKWEHKQKMAEMKSSHGNKLIIIINFAFLIQLKFFNFYIF